MVQRELARRDAIRDAISELPAREQRAAQEAEAERQRQWERGREEHERRWATAALPGPQVAPASRGGGIVGDAAFAGTGRLGRVGRWARKRIVSIPLIPLRRRSPATSDV